MGANESCIPRKRPDSFEDTGDAGIEGLRISVDPSTAMCLDPQVKRYTGLGHSHHPTTPSTTEKSHVGEGGGGGGGRGGRGGRRMKCKTQPPPKVSAEVKIPTTGGKEDLQLLQRATMPPGSFVTDWSKLSGIPQISEEELEFYDGYIGKGATAAVRKAKYQRTDVAVKLFYDIMPDEDFIQEVSIAGQLRHQNVALVLGYTTSRWIVTQFFERGSLFELLKDRQEWWSPQFVLKLATDIARGMVYIHDKGLIHRDIKTENVLISSLSCDETVVSAVITDFGISRPVSPLMTLQVGTRLYMAPEVRRGQGGGSYTNKIDVYSFGILLWELWMGSDEKFNYESCIYQMNEEGTRPVIPQCCPPPFASLISLCWHQDPDSRPTFAQVVDMLGQLQVSPVVSIQELTTLLFNERRTLVTKEEFVHHLMRECGYLKPDAESIEAVLDEDGGVSELQWLQFLKWLNPTPDDSGNAAQLINSALKDVVNTPWFHAFLSAADVNRFIEKEPAGTFMVRFSSSSPRGFALALKHSNGVSVLHYKIDPYKTGYKMFGRAYQSLGNVLQIHSTEGIRTQDGRTSCPLTLPLQRLRPTFQNEK